LLSTDGFPEVVKQDQHNKVDTGKSTSEFLAVADLNVKIMSGKASLANSDGHKFEAKYQLFSDYMTDIATFRKKFPDDGDDALPFHGGKIVEACKKALQDDQVLRDKHGSSLSEELLAYIEKGTEKLSTVNGGSNKMNEEWAHDLNLDEASQVDIAKRASETLLKSFTGAIRDRSLALQEQVEKHTRLATFVPEIASVPDTKAMIDKAVSAILKACGALFAGRVMQGMKFTGLAKRKHMAEHYKEFKLAVVKAQSDAKFEEHIHKTILGYCQDAIST
jgi:hypothetical protein